MSTKSTSVGVAGATLILWALALCFAAVSAAYWAERLSDYPVWRGVAVTASVLVSLAGPACASNVKARGLLLVLPALVFLGADTWQNMRGVQSFDFLSNGEAIAEAQAVHQSAYQAYHGLPTSQEVCTGHGPLNCGARQEGLEKDRALYAENLAKAEAALAAAKAPKFADTHVAGVMAALQLALCLALALLGRKETPAPQPAAEAVPAATQTRTVHKSYDPKVVNLMDKIGKQISA